MCEQIIPEKCSYSSLSSSKGGNFFQLFPKKKLGKTHFSTF